MNRHNLIKHAVAVLILLAFAVVVEYAVGWRRLLIPWRDMPPSGLVAAIILVFASYGVRALRLYDYFRADLRGAYPLTYRLMLQHNFFNNLLPMRSGEISFPVLMARYFAIPIARSLPALLWFRALDLCALALGAVLFAGPFWLGWPPVLAAAAGVFVLPLWLYRRLTARRARFDPAVGRGWRKAAAHLIHGLPATPGEFWRSWLLSLANWLIKLAVFAWILAFFLPMPAAAAWLGAIGGDLSSVLPIHGLAGTGTYEAGVVAGLLPFGLDPAAGLAAAVNLHLFVLGATVAGGALSLLIPRPAAVDRPGHE